VKHFVKIADPKSFLPKESMSAGFIEQLIHDFLLITEICAFKPVECIRKIEEASPGCPLQNTERPGYI
jgi:hypothetical protein